MNNKRTLVIAIISLLVLGLVVVSYFLIVKSSENKEMAALFELEKEEMENEYSTFANQYEELQVKINNDSLQVKLEREQQKTLRLLEELRQTKSTNAAEIARLKKELRTVRAVMRSYIIQIDSLNQLNEALTKENKKVRAQYREAAQQMTKLSEEKEELNQKVALAAQLDATNIRLVMKNKRGKETDKLKRATKLAIDFTVAKNPTAPTGERNIYMRLVKPNGEVLSKGDYTFDYENKKLAYSVRKYIEYTGEEQQVTIYWDVEEFLSPGQYAVYLFSDGNMIGSQEFNLE
ncbi:MAG: hypothetical protein J6K05_10625 [Bacteroidaceae bacterium]|nr:hypothetical protein [Bacteroidaceae bacterium]MBR3758325.1 hypothetical protein [Bacteroidaceae bacterium]